MILFQIYDEVLCAKQGRTGFVNSSTYVVWHLMHSPLPYWSSIYFIIIIVAVVNLFMHLYL